MKILRRGDRVFIKYPGDRFESGEGEIVTRIDHNDFMVKLTTFLIKREKSFDRIKLKGAKLESHSIVAPETELAIDKKYLIWADE